MTTEFRIVITQGVITGLALLWCWFYSAHGLSALAGGGCALLPTAYAVLRSQMAPNVNAWRALLFVQTGKMVLMSALFVISFLLVKPLNAVVFFATFICCQGGFIIGAWFATPIIPMGSLKPELDNTCRPLSGKPCDGH